MKTKFFLAALLALSVICLPNSVSAGMPEAEAYLKSQTPDAWITQALIAAGETNMSISHLSSVTEGGFNPTNDYAKTILALAAAGENPTTFGNIDYVAKLKSYYNNNQMGDATLLNDDIWSSLAFASIKKADSVEAIAAKNFLLSHQNADGGWGYAVGGSSGSNDTAAAIMALIEAGVAVNSTVITKAVAFLHTLQNNDGGFMNDPAWGTDSDSGSDGWVTSAIYKIGQDPTAWIKNGNNPLAHMQLLQDNTDGGFWWVDPAGNPAFNNKAMTAYVVIALVGKSFPIGYYEIPQPTRLTVNKSTLNFGENVIITVEYFDDQAWLPLAGAAIQGLVQNYTTDSAGQVSVALPSGDYNLLAVKEGFVSSEQVKISVLVPASPAGGSIIFVAPTYCQSVEYDVWQNTCIDNWQYRNVLIAAPTNCTLMAEQENQRKKVCVTSEGGAGDNSSLITDRKDNKNTELKPEVLGVKITGPSAAQLDRVAAEANDIISGQARDFVVAGTESTVKLGAGERAGVLNSYKSSFGKSPQTQVEWEDIIRISNNQLPLTTNFAAEKKAKMEFKKVYRREADMKNSNDQTAINMITYGLRSERRDLNSERAGIRIFVGIYQYLPVSALDWDTIRAIAYSGIDM